MPFYFRFEHVKRFARFHFPFILLLVSFFLACLFLINDLNLYTPDSTRYLVWARSLSAFQGYHDATLPDPIRYVVHAPLYPLLLAPIAFLVPYGIVAAKIWSLLFSLGALCCFYRWLSLYAGVRVALLGCIVLCVNPLFLIFSTEILSDVPFVLCLILLLMLMDNYEHLAHPAAIIACVITVAILLREVGFSLLLATLAFQVLRQRWKGALLILGLSATVYLTWYVRNEFMIASVEFPTLTNAKLFASHFFTPASSGIVGEWGARIANNLSVYAASLGKLVFFPFHGLIQFDVVYLDRFPVSAVNSIITMVKYPLIMVTMCFIAGGLFHDFKKSTTAVYRVIIVLLYTLVILLYPVNDMRFLLPLLILMVFYFCAGVAALNTLGNSKGWSSIVFIGACILLVPNILWDGQYIDNSRMYISSPISFYASTVGLKKYPSHFTQPLRLAGEWINRDTRRDAVILTQWKDLVCWVEGRKVLPADQTTSLTDFEAFIRDYGITYLVAVVQKNGAREFDLQMHQTRRFVFTIKERIANVEIYSIAPKMSSGRMFDSTTVFRRGLSYLNEGSYLRAAELFEEARGVDSMNISLAFYTAVAKGFLMDLDGARSRFAALGALPQSLMYVEEANLHVQMIDHLSLATTVGNLSERANEYFRAAGLCWNLGFRVRARELIRASCAVDSSFFPAPILAVHFAIVEGDTDAAREFANKARILQPGHPAVKLMVDIIARFDSLRKEELRSSRSRELMVISSDYRQLGITDAAIESALLANREDSTNVNAVTSLAEIYTVRRKWSPARKYLGEAILLRPEEMEFRAQWEAIQVHF